MTLSESGIAAFLDEVAQFRDALCGLSEEFSYEQYLAGVGRAICRARFAGRGGPSEYKVMVGAWRIAVAAKTCWPTLPLRRLTGEAGIGSRETTAKALSRLVEAGWLQLVGETNGLRGNQYGLCVPKELQGEVRKPGTVGPPSESQLDGEALGEGLVGEPLEDSWLIKDDAFAYKALGASAARLYVHLIARHRTRRELVDVTGLHRDTVKRNLRRLTDEGLVVEDGPHWRAVPCSAARLDAIARHYGTAGRHEAQAQRHERERQRNVLRRVEDIVSEDTDPKDWHIVDEGILANLRTGEVADVYGQFQWLDRYRVGIAATPRQLPRA